MYVVKFIGFAPLAAYAVEHTLRMRFNTWPGIVEVATLAAQQGYAVKRLRSVTAEGV